MVVAETGSTVFPTVEQSHSLIDSEAQLLQSEMPDSPVDGDGHEGEDRDGDGEVGDEVVDGAVQ